MIKVSKVLVAENMQSGVSDPSRKLGKPLSEDPRVVSKKLEYIKAYRAVADGTTTFKDMDYVTLSRTFAEGHAEHGAAVDEIPYQVISAVIPVGWLCEAYNPGEYFFHRKDCGTTKGKIIYTANPEIH